MTQLAIDFSAPARTLTSARAARDAGIERSLKAADDRAPSWSSVAYQFLEQYARKHATFSPEDVTDAAASWGLTASDARAWGGVYKRAQNARIIERSDVPYARRFGHASKSFGWRSLIAHDHVLPVVV